VNRPRIVAAFAPPTPPIKIDGVHLAAKPTTVDAGRFPVALLWSEAGATGAMIKADASPNNYGDVIRAAVADAVARLVAKKIAVETIHAVVVGGADSARWKTDKLVKALGNAGLADVKTFDLNGAFYRAVRFDPTDGDIQIVREEVVAAHTNPGSASLSLDDAVRGFSVTRRPSPPSGIFSSPKPPAVSLPPPSPCGAPPAPTGWKPTPTPCI